MEAESLFVEAQPAAKASVATASIEVKNFIGFNLREIGANGAMAPYKGRLSRFFTGGSIVAGAGTQAKPRPIGSSVHALRLHPRP